MLWCSIEPKVPHVLAIAEQWFAEWILRSGIGDLIPNLLQFHKHRNKHVEHKSTKSCKKRHTSVLNGRFQPSPEFLLVNLNLKRCRVGMIWVLTGTQYCSKMFKWVRCIMNSGVSDLIKNVYIWHYMCFTFSINFTSSVQFIFIVQIISQSDLMLNLMKEVSFA